MRVLSLCVGVLLLATPVSAQILDTATKVLTVSGLGLHVVDLTQTTFGLASGRVVEVNPLGRAFTNQPEAMALVKMGTATASAWIVWKLREKHPKLAFVTSAVMTGAITAVVVNNARAIR